MEVTVTFREWDASRRMEAEDGAPVQSMLDHFGFHAHAVLVLKGGEPVPENAPMEEGAGYEVIAVASGG
jgi:sulfur carrier protein ThiS